VRKAIIDIARIGHLFIGPHDPLIRAAWLNVTA